jgi:hypothetical protein
MMVGCYSLHLYCDRAGCPNGRALPDGDQGRPPGEFTHDKNEAGAMRRARKAGWKILTDWTCLCPACAKKP